jgi:hypothetical protein
MKYIKKYESNKLEEKITRADIEDFFAHSFDLCNKYEIDESYFDPADTRNWAHNDFSNPGNENLPSICLNGFSIEFNHEFYDREIELKIFKKYVTLINQIDEDLDRFKAFFKIKDIFFEERSNDSITLIIANTG